MWLSHGELLLLSGDFRVGSRLAWPSIGPNRVLHFPSSSRTWGLQGHMYCSNSDVHGLRSVIPSRATDSCGNYSIRTLAVLYTTFILRLKYYTQIWTFCYPNPHQPSTMSRSFLNLVSVLPRYPSASNIQHPLLNLPQPIPLIPNKINLILRVRDKSVDISQYWWLIS
jgi:hypothetical protein